MSKIQPVVLSQIVIPIPMYGYLSPLSDMSPATSDCLEPYLFFLFFIFLSNYRVCVDFSGSFFFFLILFFFTVCTLLG